MLAHQVKKRGEKKLYVLLFPLGGLVGSYASKRGEASNYYGQVGRAKLGGGRGLSKAYV
jgi:hypothetical protein